MEIALYSIFILLAGLLLGDSFGHRRGFRAGQKDEQIFIALVITSLAKRTNDTDLIGKVSREYNVLLLQLQQAMKDVNEGR